MDSVTNLKTWIVKNKLTTFLVVVILLLIAQLNNSAVRHPRTFLGSPVRKANYGYDVAEEGYAPAYSGVAVMDTALREPMPPIIDEFAPTLDIQDRKVITNSQMSLLVKDVRQTADQIATEADVIGGYFVDKNIYTPEEGGTGYVTIRIPVTKRDHMVEYLRDVGIRVISENIQANDITDQFTDIEARLETLNKTLARYQEILDEATNVDEILRVQQNIFRVQEQMDRYKGTLQALTAKSSTTLISINLTTDELALPYSPGAPWNPNKVFKLAVRSLVQNLRNLGDMGIWLAVYSVVWIPALLIIKIFKNWQRDKAKNKKDTN